jgi:uroporphyrinogen decarboxylase
MIELTPRERVWQSIQHQQPDKTPWHLGFTPTTRLKLEQYYGTTDLDTTLNQHIVKFRARMPYTDIKPNYVRDEFGVVLNQTYDEYTGVPDEYLLKDIPLKDFPFPDPHNPERLIGLPAFLDTNPDRFRLVGFSFTLFERAWFLRGMEDLLVDMLNNPTYVDELLDRILEFNMGILEDVVKYDIDGVSFNDDWGQQNGLIFGARLWRRFIKPRMTQLYKFAKDSGKAVFIHCCGKAQELFPELIEMGVDVFNPFQPEVMDPYEMKKQFGSRISFYGGVSIQKLLPFGTPAEIDNEVNRLIKEVGQGGGFIIAPSHEMPGDIPIENLVALINSVQSQK